jgi:hypothetical protein
VWSDLVMRCVRMLPEQRPQGMGEVIGGLEAAQCAVGLPSA